MLDFIVLANKTNGVVRLNFNLAEKQFLLLMELLLPREIPSIEVHNVTIKAVVASRVNLLIFVTFKFNVICYIYIIYN